MTTSIPPRESATLARLHGRTRRVLLATGVAAVAVAALPAAASAATVGIDNDGTLRYRAPDGETNSLSVQEFADAIVVRDARGVRPARIFGSFAQSCVAVDSTTVRCPDSPVGISRIEASLGDRNDTAGRMNTQFPVLISGGDGRDTYAAGSPAFLTRVEFRGGRGQDTASYAGSGGSGGGRGVRISNDGVVGDGRLGLDADNIGRDVEELTGSTSADEITANGPPPFSSTGEFLFTFVRGGQGDDVMRVGSTGSFVTFRMGPVADGADRIIGGSVDSAIDYSERTRQVTATLNFGGADDGEAGEGDEILGGNEVLVGGQAGDILRAPFRSTAAHVIRGQGGGDFIEGGDGPDELDGGAGRLDVIVGQGGDDEVLVKDGERDTVDCGLETDTVEVDANDSLSNCENGTIGVLRLAPNALRTRVGETARLKLSWTHPRSWTQLRRVTLRLYRGKRRVGEVALDPRERRLHDRGRLTVLRRSTRLTRKGTTVSARLALQLDRSLAGQRLRLEVEAVDTDGARQLERDAGSIRVARQRRHPPIALGRAGVGRARG